MSSRFLMTRRLPRRTLGVSLIELMVAMAIGLVVVGAVFTNFINTSAGTRQTAALAQLTGDATVALGILRNHIAIAGHGSPKKLDEKKIETNFTGPALLGCDYTFKDVGEEVASNLECKDAPAPKTTKEAGEGEGEGADDGSSTLTPTLTQGGTLMVRYEADSDLTPEVNTKSDGLRLSDCSGEGVVTASPVILDSRFQVDLTATPPALECWGNGGKKSQPIVENIVSMQLSYGIGADDTSGNGKLLRVVRYLPAKDVTDWSKVLAVRVCVVARSAEQVLSKPTPFRDCDQSVIPPTDRYIYRAFTSTVLINNRLSSQALNSTP